MFFDEGANRRKLKGLGSAYDHTLGAHFRDDGIYFGQLQ